MIKLIRPRLSTDTNSQLNLYHGQIIDILGYETRVNSSASTFKQYNVKGNRCYDSIKINLKSMCKGATRCHYCEDSAPDEVEHFRPKSLYPEYCFNWENYLYSCGVCNGSFKRSNFKIFSSANGSIVDITRKHGDPIRQPVHGVPVLIDPANDNPLDYMELDLFTLNFVPIDSLPSNNYERAKYTIELLGLNSRDVLVEGRRAAFGSFKARLLEYVNKKSQHATQDELNQLKHNFFLMPHFTVWEEMKRQANYASNLHREILNLFRLAPETLRW